MNWSDFKGHQVKVSDAPHPDFQLASKASSTEASLTNMMKNNTNLPPPEKRVKRSRPGLEWLTPTTYAQRFTETITLLCGGRTPPADMIVGWLDPESEDDRLQNFALDNGPAWAQGCVILDAAALLAGELAEGAEHALKLEHSR